jgi:hypothetical protein
MEDIMIPNKTPKVPSIYNLSADDILLVTEMMRRLRRIGLISLDQIHEYLEIYYISTMIDPEGTEL